MKLLTGHELLTKLQNGEDISNVYVTNTTEIKGSNSQIESGRGYLTLLPVKGNLCVDSIFCPTLIIIDISE